MAMQISRSNVIAQQCTSLAGSQLAWPILLQLFDVNCLFDPETMCLQQKEKAVAAAQASAG